MKTYSKGWVWLRLARIQNSLGVSQKELAQILDMDGKNLRRLMRTTLGRVNGNEFPLAKLDELDKLVKLSRIALKKGRLKNWIRDTSIPVYDGSAPIDHLKNGDFGLPMHSLAVIAGITCA